MSCHVISCHVRASHKKTNSRSHRGIRSCVCRNPHLRVPCLLLIGAEAILVHVGHRPASPSSWGKGRHILGEAPFCLPLGVYYPPPWLLELSPGELRPNRPGLSYSFPKLPGEKHERKAQFKALKFSRALLFLFYLFVLA